MYFFTLLRFGITFFGIRMRIQTIEFPFLRAVSSPCDSKRCNRRSVAHRLAFIPFRPSISVVVYAWSFCRRLSNESVSSGSNGSTGLSEFLFLK